MLTLLPRIVQKQQNKNIAMKGIFIMELSNTLDKSCANIWLESKYF